MKNKPVILLLLLGNLLCACRSNIHDDASSLAERKCKLLWINKEYEKVQMEFLGGMRRNRDATGDTSQAGSAEMNAVEMVAKEKELSSKMESLNDDMKGLDKDIESMTGKFYKKYNEKEISTLNMETKAMVDQCRPN